MNKRVSRGLQEPNPAHPLGRWFCPRRCNIGGTLYTEGLGLRSLGGVHRCQTISCNRRSFALQGYHPLGCRGGTSTPRLSQVSETGPASGSPESCCCLGDSAFPPAPRLLTPFPQQESSAKDEGLQPGEVGKLLFPCSSPRLLLGFLICLLPEPCLLVNFPPVLWQGQLLI